jgi:NTP pyrophosphatase (non-canonical NTP hydrolase)
MIFSEMQKAVHQLSMNKGWYDCPIFHEEGGDSPESCPYCEGTRKVKRNIPEMLALIHSEISEALEEYRQNRMSVWEATTPLREVQKPEGFPIELADAVIRIMDLAEHLGINLEEAITTKHAFNMTRPYRHNHKKC